MCNAQIGFDEKELNLVALGRRLQSILDVSKEANEYFDKSGLIDAIASSDFIRKTIPAAPPLSDGERVMIETSMEFLNKPFVRIPGSFTKRSSIDMFHYLPSEDSTAFLVKGWA